MYKRQAETYSEVVKGMMFNNGYITPYMVTDTDKMEALSLIHIWRGPSPAAVPGTGADAAEAAATPRHRRAEPWESLKMCIRDRLCSVQDDHGVELWRRC